MKQKFTITIADIEMNILSEGSADEIEATVNKVDRKIRDICQKSPRITKNEAALLCALEYCALCENVQKDINQNDEEYEALREDNAKLADALEKLTARFNAQKERYESATSAQKERYETAATTLKEKYEGRIDIMKEKYEGRINALRAKIDEMKRAAEDSSRAASATAAEAPRQIESSGDGESSSAAAQTAADEQPEQITIEAAPATESAPGAAESAVSIPAAADKTEAVAAVLPGDAKKEPRAKGKNSKVGTMFELLTFNDV